jgi:hypothetical protein
VKVLATGCLIWKISLNLEDLTEAELDHLKGGFTKLAGNEPNALLRSASQDLDAAGAEIEEAKERVTSVASGKF